VEGSFFTRLCARNEDLMGFSSGGGWELFSAEYVAAIAPCEDRVGEVTDQQFMLYNKSKSLMAVVP